MGKLDELAQVGTCVYPVGVLNGPHHEPLVTDTHAGMLIDITVLPSTGRPADLQGGLVSEQVSQSFDHTGSLAEVPAIASQTSGFQPAASVPPDQHVLLKEFIIDRALNHGGNGSLSVHQLDVFTHPACGVTAPTVIPESGHRIDMIITSGDDGSIELTARKSAENCTYNSYTTQAGPSFTHFDTVLVQPRATTTECPPEPVDFAVSDETLFANPKFDFEFSPGDNPSLITRAPSAPFRWNAKVKTQKPVQGCFELGFLQTLGSAFQAAVYRSQADGEHLFCQQIVPTPVRDAKVGAPEPWYEHPVRLGTNCFPEIDLPPGISGNLDESTTELDDNPFTRWCIFLDQDAENAASECGSSDAAFRLDTLVEELKFDVWLVLRPLGSSDPSCFAFLRNASWSKSVQILVAPSETLGFLKHDLGVTVLENGDGPGTTTPELGSDTAKDTAERVCVTTNS